MHLFNRSSNSFAYQDPRRPAFTNNISLAAIIKKIRKKNRLGMPRWAGKYPSYLMLPAGNKILPSALLILPLRTDRLSDRALGGQIRGAAVRHVVLPKQQPAAPRAPGITRAVRLPRPLWRSEPSLLLIMLTQLKSRLSTVPTRCKEREGEEMRRKKNNK